MPDKMLEILEHLDEDPEVKQADLASRLGIGVGTVNWHIKRLTNKGLVKIKRIGQWSWRYILTPKGMKEKARLTKNYISNSMELYRETRAEAQKLLQEARGEGYERIGIKGGNDLVDVCRLTSIEEGLEVVDSDIPQDYEEEDLPIIEIDGRELTLNLP